MSILRRGRVALISIALVALPSSAAAFATIPEDEVFVREGRRELIHIRIQEGCDEAATDRVEVQIPEGVLAVIPQAVPGWTATTETEETEPYEIFGQEQTDRVSRVIWTGGPLEADEFQDFGIAAVFTEPADELVFPVVQGCGSEERSWDEVPEEDQERSDLARPAPVVRVVEPPTTDIPGLQAELGELRTELENLRTEFEDLRLGEIPGTRLRERLQDVERRLDELEEEQQ
jgi:periplasmic copper chaperone A